MDEALEAAEALGISTTLAQCLLNRGIEQPDAMSSFISPSLKRLADPFRIVDMELMVDLLLKARENGESLVIFGDYDADGVTATTLLLESLTAFGWKVNYYLPHRLDEGYGLSLDSVKNCVHQFNPDILLAVDCGSTAVDTIKWLKDQGISTLVLDHHQISIPKPPATALVNPLSQIKNNGHDTELCSVGLAFKLAHAILKRGRQTGMPGAYHYDIRKFLDLVAIGTIADLVPLTGENRILVNAGLARLEKTRRTGLLALKKVAAVSNPIGSFEVGFQLAPRLNAAGRLQSATKALELLTAEDTKTAEIIALDLDAQNRERRKIEDNIAHQVIESVRSRLKKHKDLVIVEGGLYWHIGVVGIVAARVVREFYRPVILVGGDTNEWRGSGRSIDGFDLADALRHCNDLLIQHGGHAMAAGLSLHPDNLPALRRRLNNLAAQKLPPDKLRPILNIDAEISLPELTLDAVGELNLLNPTGQHNPTIQLVVKNVSLQRPPEFFGKQKQHSRLWITDGSTTQEAIAWRMSGRKPPSGRFDLAFSPKINNFKGKQTVQLQATDWQNSMTTH